MTSDRGDAAFLAALDRNRGILLKVASAYCRDGANREDLIQEMAAQLWRALPKFDHRRSLSARVYRIAVNVAISFFRTQRRQVARLERVDAATIEEFVSPPDPVRDPRLEDLYEMIRSLDDLNRALMLLYLDDRPYAEIADIKHGGRDGQRRAQGTVEEDRRAADCEHAAQRAALAESRPREGR